MTNGDEDETGNGEEEANNEDQGVPPWVNEMNSPEGIFWRAKYEELNERHESTQEMVRSQQFQQRSSVMAREALPDIGGAGAEITVNTDPVDIFERFEIIVAIVSSAFTIIAALLFVNNYPIIPPYVQILTGLIAIGLLIDYFWNRHGGEDESPIDRLQKRMS